MTREVIEFDPCRYQINRLYIHGQDTSLGVHLTIYPYSMMKAIPGKCVIFVYRNSGDHYRVYIANYNAYELLVSDAPPWVIIDALLEAPDEEWSGSKTNELLVPQTRELLEKLALMELVPMERP